MALRYSVVAFGKQQGPWRIKQRQAERDACALGLGEYDDWGQFYLSAHASIAWAREEDVMRPRAAAHPASCTRTHALQS